jgi:ABC-type phosphate transport system substrate-binding protein
LFFSTLKIRRCGAQALVLLAAGLSDAVAAASQEVVAVVSAKSAVTALSSSQVADIFLGRATRFPDGTVAVPIDLNEESPERDRFYEQYTGKSPAQVKAHWSKIIFTGRGQPPRQASNSSEAKKLIAENPNAIGYIDGSAVDRTVRVLPSR